jgi:TonB family protein
MKKTLLVLVILLALAPATHGARFAFVNPQTAVVRVAVLELGEGATAARVSERIAKLLSEASAGEGRRLLVLDRGMSRAAARGAGYAGSLNMTLAEARSLGASIGCDFYVTGDAQTVRRSSSTRPVYYESYASVFVVSSRTGGLVTWERPAAEADTADAAEASLLALLDAKAGARYASALTSAFVREERERFNASNAEANELVIDLSGDEAAHTDLREPAPFRRLRPAYTEAAYRAEAEATVDASVEIGADGEVRDVEIVRWAGFGLDEEVASTIRRMHFRPAERDGEPLAVRVLLRYNFRRPPPKQARAGDER